MIISGAQENLRLFVEALVGLIEVGVVVGLNIGLYASNLVFTSGGYPLISWSLHLLVEPLDKESCLKEYNSYCLRCQAFDSVSVLSKAGHVMLKDVVPKEKFKLVH